MSEFLTKLDVEAINDFTWKLINPLMYRSDILGFIIGVPRGFVTDFASVPRLPLAFLVAGDTAHQAATIHDYLYHTHITDRETADRVLLEAMEDTAIPLWRRRVIYRAVRLFGWMAWRGGMRRFTILNGPA